MKFVGCLSLVLVASIVSSASAGRVGALSDPGTTFGATPPMIGGAAPGVGVFGTFEITTAMVPIPAPADPNAHVDITSNESVVRVVAAATGNGTEGNTFNWTITTTANLTRVVFQLRDVAGAPTGIVFDPLTSPPGWIVGPGGGSQFIAELASPNTSPAGSTITFDFDLDIPSNATGTVDLVMGVSNPEPGSIFLGSVAIAMMGGAGYWKRRRKKIAPANEEETTAV